MLQPKKVKYRKKQKGRTRGMAKGGTEVAFGTYGLKATEPGWICMGAMGSWAVFVRNALLRRIWCGVFPERGLCGMPPGWAHGKCGNPVSIPIALTLVRGEDLIEALDAFAGRDLNPLAVWIENRAGESQHDFEKLALQEDMELLKEVCHEN